MTVIVRNVKDIDTAGRQALEHVIGYDLRENQQIIITVVTADSDDASAHSREQEPINGSQQEVPEWWNIYEGLSEEEIDRLDQAIRHRASLTRFSE